MTLLDFLYQLSIIFKADESFLEKVQVKRIFRFFIMLLSNSILKIVFRFHTPESKDEVKLPIVVSLTSFPARIANVWMTIESILRQKSQPQCVVLYLSREQFPNEYNDLPRRLLNLQTRGLHIRFVDGDIRSYKKFYYSFSEFKNTLILTIDDDLLIPSYFLDSIYKCKLLNPNNVIASFGFRYYWDEQEKYISISSNVIHPGESGNDLFFGSGGGTLFDSSIANYMDDIELIRKICPTADDIYLNALSRVSGYGITFHLNNPLLSIINRNDVKLVDHNGNIGSSDSNNAMQLRQLLHHFNEKYGVNPFKL